MQGGNNATVEQALAPYDDIGGLWLRPVAYVPMSTAIVRIYTPEGFVIAADGRKGNTVTREVATDSVQKVFPVDHSDKQLAYSFAGTAGIGAVGAGEALLFDFPLETKRAIDRFLDIRFKSLWHFTEALMNALVPLLDEAKAKRLKALGGTPPESEAQTYIFIDGYHQGRPKKTRITFRHHGSFQSNTEEDASTEELEGGAEYGDPQILKLLDSEDDTFAAFRPARIHSGLSLDQAVTVANNRIRAQCSLIAREIAPKCHNIGGRIHIATVTFAHGFRWVHGFEPQEQG